MKSILFLLLFLPFLCISQSISIDSISNTSRIEFLNSPNNIFIGEGSGGTLSTGSNNVLLGRLAGSVLSSGERNIFLGNNAGQSTNTGSFNISLGFNSGFSNQLGIGNISIGDESGYSDALGSFNVRIGDFAGRNAVGSSNVLIGANAGFNHTGDNQLYIDNSSTSQPLIHGFFDKDSLVINGDVNFTGKLTGDIDVSNITGILGSGNSAVFPEVMDNMVSIEISGILDSDSEVLITNSIGYQIDTFTLFGSSCLDPQTGFSNEFPLVFETADATDISDLQAWFANPDARSLAIIFRDIAGNETYRFNLYEYYPQSTSAGSDGRTSFTLINNLPPSNSVGVEIEEYLGSAISFNPTTDKLVEITGISHDNFCPSVQVDYSKRVITLEMTYNEGDGLVDWINSISDGSSTLNLSMSIIETVSGPGSTEISRENFYEILPFKYEVTYGFGLNTKVISRIQILYGCNGPG